MQANILPDCSKAALPALSVVKSNSVIILMVGRQAAMMDGQHWF